MDKSWQLIEQFKNCYQMVVGIVAMSSLNFFFVPTAVPILHDNCVKMDAAPGGSNPDTVTVVYVSEVNVSGTRSGSNSELWVKVSSSDVCSAAS